MRLHLVFLGVVFACGCAHTSFYSDAEMTRKTGFRYYTARPYLLVSFTNNKDKLVEVSVVYLPDLEHPQFAVPHPGWGNSEFHVTVADGSVASVGGRVEATGPETLTALGSLLTSASALTKALAEARAGGTGEAPDHAFELYEIRQEGGRTKLIRVMPERSPSGAAN
jgi:hypothetical protein